MRATVCGKSLPQLSAVFLGVVFLRNPIEAGVAHEFTDEQAQNEAKTFDSRRTQTIAFYDFPDKLESHLDPLVYLFTDEMERNGETPVQIHRYVVWKNGLNLVFCPKGVQDLSDIAKRIDAMFKETFPDATTTDMHEQLNEIFTYGQGSFSITVDELLAIHAGGLWSPQMCLKLMKYIDQLRAKGLVPTWLHEIRVNAQGNYYYLGSDEFPKKALRSKRRCKLYRRWRVALHFFELQAELAPSDSLTQPEEEEGLRVDEIARRAATQTIHCWWWIHAASYREPYDNQLPHGKPKFIIKDSSLLRRGKTRELGTWGTQIIQDYTCSADNRYQLRNGNITAYNSPYSMNKGLKLYPHPCYWDGQLFWADGQAFDLARNKVQVSPALKMAYVLRSNPVKHGYNCAELSKCQEDAYNLIIDMDAWKLQRKARRKAKSN